MTSSSSGLWNVPDYFDRSVTRTQIHLSAFFLPLCLILLETTTWKSDRPKYKSELSWMWLFHCVYLYVSDLERRDGPRWLSCDHTRETMGLLLLYVNDVHFQDDRANSQWPLDRRRCGKSSLKQNGVILFQNACRLDVITVNARCQLTTTSVVSMFRAPSRLLYVYITTSWHRYAKATVTTLTQMSCSIYEHHICILRLLYRVQAVLSAAKSI